MAYKILEQNGVTNENVDGAAFNLFCSGRKDGILEGILNECRLISTSSNIIGIDTGVFLVQGFRVKIYDAMYWSMVASDTPGAYHLIFSLTVNKDRSVVGEFSVEKDNYLTKDQIPLDEQGLYQIQILRFDWDGGAISNLSKTMPIISAQEAAVENVPAKIQASMSEDERYILKLSLTNKDGEEIAGSSSEIDLPLEMAFVGAALVKDEDGNEFVEFTLQNGEKLRVGLSEIFKGKVDKVNTKRIVYGTGNNGEPVQRYISQTPSTNAVPQYSSDGRLQTNAPVEDLDCVNKETMEDGLSKKLDKVTSTGTNTRVYGINAKGEQLLISLFTKNKQGYIPIYGTKDGVSGDSDEGSVIVTGMPEKPYHAAPMKYVDGKVEPLQRDIRVLNEAALGILYTFEKIDTTELVVSFPEGCFPTAYIDSLINVVALSSSLIDGSHKVLGTAEITEFTFLDADMGPIGSLENPQMGVYFEIPEGAVSFYVRHTDWEWFDGDPTENYMEHCDLSIIYQIKVGA